MRLRVKGLILNFAYEMLIKCAESIAKTNDIDIETALSLISLVEPEIYWTKRYMKHIAAKLTDVDEYYYQAKQMRPVFSFYSDCTKHVNRSYTRLLDCACVEKKTKKTFGFSALDLYYVKKYLTLGSGSVGEEG